MADPEVTSLSTLLQSHAGNATLRALRAHTFYDTWDREMYRYTEINGHRAADARLWACFAYFFCFFVIVVDTLLTALLLGWAYTAPRQAQAASDYYKARDEGSYGCCGVLQEDERRDDEGGRSDVDPRRQGSPLGYGSAASDDEGPPVQWLDPESNEEVQFKGVQGAVGKKRMLCTVGDTARGVVVEVLWPDREHVTFRLMPERTLEAALPRESDLRGGVLRSLAELADSMNVKHNIPPDAGMAADEALLRSDYAEHHMPLPAERRDSRVSRRQSRAMRRYSMKARTLTKRAGRLSLARHATEPLDGEEQHQQEEAQGCNGCVVLALSAIGIDANDPRAMWGFFFAIITVLYWGICFGAGGTLGALIGSTVLLCLKVYVFILWCLFPCRMHGCCAEQIDYEDAAHPDEASTPHPPAQAEDGMGIIAVDVRKVSLSGAEKEEKAEQDAAPESCCGRWGPIWRENWTARPSPLGRAQCLLASLLGGTIVASVAALMLMVFLWTPETYWVWSRNNQQMVEEHEPLRLTAMSLQFVYSWPKFATNMRMDWFAKEITKTCGSIYRGSADSADLRDWVSDYRINMNWFDPIDPSLYGSLNNLLIRPFSSIATMRPVDGAEGGDTGRACIVSPADARVVAFQDSDTSRLWVKGSGISYRELVHGNGPNGGKHWDGGPQIVFRMAPQDYHRFHSPVTGNITFVRKYEATYWANSETAHRSENKAFINTRYVILIDTYQGTPGQTSNVGLVAVVAVGATCVGSVRLFKGHDLTGSTGLPEPHVTEWKVGDFVTKGDQLGIMQFGGSTVVLLFEHGKVAVDYDVMKRSLYPVETLVSARQQIGTAVWNQPLNPVPPAPGDTADPPQACC
eukprot:TRINITY_DN45131_c0_g2_i2.p1 TRINITY_DN45131_c0_g2~~TRINITY_DN45131_c0_g2_i2.p1  ORF type:complete len:859 (+),score=268.46 TRINITY_DN45131_c0_g2_i2:213-2789(+)